jgi:CubicO group peptidase (beta-lactamase class C family)
LTIYAADVWLKCCGTIRRLPESRETKPVASEESYLLDLLQFIIVLKWRIPMALFRLKRYIQCIIILWFICWFNQATSSAATDYWPTEGWRTSTPEKQGMHSGFLADMLEYIQEGGYRIDSITIIRNGYMVTDAYFFPFQKGTKHPIASCTKSITSALVGIALDKGYIKKVNQPLLQFFPDRTIANLDEHKRAITLEHLLTMTTGLHCRDTYQYKWEGLNEMKKSGDCAQYVLDLPMDEAPGKRFEYCNGASYLLSVIIQKTTKSGTLEFARKYLFGPLGITDVKWRTSPQGVNNGFAGILLTPHDMAKIGWLYLNKGRWDDTQIVPAAWVKASTGEHISIAPFHYGYQWWGDPDGYYMASGREGQRIFVIPKKNMVVVFTAALPNERLPRALLNEYIIPAAVSSKPLPVNSQEKARLDSSLEICAQAPLQGFIWISEKDGEAKNGVFVRTASPAFRFEYPICSRQEETNDPNQVMSMKAPEGTHFQAFIIDIPEGMKLADMGPKVHVSTLEKLGTNVNVISNREIRLKDGTKAYRTDIEWLSKDISLTITRTIVSAFKDGKCVFLAADPWRYPHEVAPVVGSLTFK